MTKSKGAGLTLHELMVTSLAMCDSVAKLLIEKGIFSEKDLMRKISKERATYQKLLKPILK